MKSNFIIFFLLFFFNFGILNADKYSFEVSSIEVNEKGNLINAYNGKIFSKESNLEISAEKYKYNKDLDFLEATNGKVILIKENIEITFNRLTINKRNILTLSDNIFIKDLQNSLEIESEKIVLDRNKNILTASDKIFIKDLQNSLEIESEKIVLDGDKKLISSNTKSIINDINKNSIMTDIFRYSLNDEVIKIINAQIKDSENNNIKIKSAFINLKTNSLEGYEININLNNSILDPENEPRLAGKSVNYKGEVTEISDGLFTTCKKRDNCPPWELSADKIVHDKKKKSISYKNVWLKVYDVPVAYFPKFFHPDPSVKRQSGFLMPTFKTSSNNSTYFSVPYFKAISQNKDLTFTPRFFAKDKLLIQNEYRKVEKNSKTKTDISIYTNKGEDFEGHFFYNFNKDLILNNFINSKLDLKIETASNDTYLKSNNITSPIIRTTDLLEKSIKLNVDNENTNIEANLIVFKNLNKKDNDKYEYILPKINLSRKINSFTKLDGDLNFKTENFIHNRDTNIFERVNNNSLIFNSSPEVSKNGFYNNYEFILKNSNTNSQKSPSHKDGEDLYVSGLFQFNSSFPLIKKREDKTNLFRPKISLKLSPGHTKDLSKNEYKLDVNNIFNLDRLSSNETLEGGMSLAYGSDYILTNNNNNNEILSLKFANNLRLKKNSDLERNNQIGSKTSNFFGEIKYSQLSFINAKYNLSISNNLTDINYQNLLTEIKFNNFSTTLDYLRQDGEKNSYLLNKTSYNFNETNNLTFSTRENLKTNLTEFYNLIYQYKNDCLAASVEYQKDYYKDREIKPKESVFFKLSIIPFGTTSTPNLKN